MWTLLLLACTTETPPDDSAAPEDTGPPPCPAVEAVFFDLGETLVTERDDGLFEEIPAAIALLDALELPLGVITNMRVRDTREDLEALLVDPSLLDRFDVVLLSSEAEADPKPDPAIFAEAVALLPEPPPIEQTVFVTEEIGDLADADPPTEGAQAAGMIGVHVTADEPSPLADHTVTPEEMATVADAAWMGCIDAR
jgi:FMN phosphatase YigB (HAD superfamily)